MSDIELIADPSGRLSPAGPSKCACNCIPMTILRTSQASSSQCSRPSTAARTQKPTRKSCCAGSLTPQNCAPPLSSKSLASEQNTRWLVVTDADAGNQVVSAAGWHIVTNCTSSVLEPWEPEVDYFESREEREAVSKAMKTLTTNVGNEIRKAGGSSGEPHVRLKLLFTDPEYQRQGAGSTQVQWGCRLVDFFELPMWVEASTNGKAMNAADSGSLHPLS